MSRTAKALCRSAQSYSPSSYSIEHNDYPKDARPPKQRSRRDRRRMQARLIETAAGINEDLDRQWANAVENETHEESRTRVLERRADGQYN